MEHLPRTSVRSQLLGPRRGLLLAILLAGVWAAWQLELQPADLMPSAAGRDKLVEFFRAALSPATDYERPPPPGTAPFLAKVAQSMWQTLVTAFAAVSLSLAGGLIVGFAASTAWWEDDPVHSYARRFRWLWRSAAPLAVAGSRVIIAFARSVHELLWAVLFLSALGLNNLTAILAIAIPYAGVFGKVFSEIIDEAPRGATHALRDLGATGTTLFVFGLIPQAVGDMTAYAFYRLECGTRSAAVMGFFGIPTIGFYLRPSFDEQHYHEVWTYLYALIALVVVLEWWSYRVRRSCDA